MAVDCPICNKPVKPSEINSHIDSGCTSFIIGVDKQPTPPQSQQQREQGTERPASEREEKIMMADLQSMT